MSTTFIENNSIAFASNNNGESWQISQKKGMLTGITGAVSGLGATVKLKGDMTFDLISLESSSTYNKLLNEYKFGGGVSGFFTWIGLSVNAEVHKEEIHEVLEQLQNSQKVTGRVTIDMNVTGLYPNVEVTAMAYVNVLQIENSTGNTFRIASAGNPIDDTGATDENGNDLPTKDNNSVIYL
ncbi:hypothetical protein AB6H10_10795 [Providencia vermicola]|uniref:hypothetical protein n=1 Tax=Providencia vermicola TaxID=333965 RepID=UPI0034DD87D9